MLLLMMAGAALREVYDAAAPFGHVFPHREPRVRFCVNYIARASIVSADASLLHAYVCVCVCVVSVYFNCYIGRAVSAGLGRASAARAAGSHRRTPR